ncbi:MAG: RNA-binding S4 domain-containing protein, partial [Chromatiales bacterium]|nr:RNA-binding S4 domain-containing protein [Chromatiales bacterium]
LEWDITVLMIPRQRRPASEAIHFYQETTESIEKREQIIEEQRILKAAAPKIAPEKPSKRDRRMIQRFTGKG